MSTIVLTEEQIEALARPIVKMLPRIVEFYKDPENQRRFEEWLEKRNREREDREEATA